jgi:hypothetical protein
MLDVSNAVRHAHDRVREPASQARPRAPRQTSEAAWPRGITMAAVLALTVIAVYARRPGYLLSHPFWFDEGWVADSVRAPLGQLRMVTSSTPIGWTLLLRGPTARRARTLPAPASGLRRCRHGARLAAWAAAWPSRRLVAAPLAGLAAALGPAALFRRGSSSSPRGLHHAAAGVGPRDGRASMVAAVAAAVRPSGRRLCPGRPLRRVCDGGGSGGARAQLPAPARLEKTGLVGADRRWCLGDPVGRLPRVRRPGELGRDAGLLDAAIHPHRPGLDGAAAVVGARGARFLTFLGLSAWPVTLGLTLAGVAAFASARLPATAMVTCGARKPGFAA